jgi:hypothetical protein
MEGNNSCNNCKEKHIGKKLFKKTLWKTSLFFSWLAMSHEKENQSHTLNGALQDKDFIKHSNSIICKG